MFHIRQSLVFDHPAARVWPYLIAFEQVPLWESGVLEVRQETPGPTMVGSVIVARRTFGGRETTLTGTIVAYDEGRSARMALRGWPLDRVIAEYAVEPIDGDHSIVTYLGEGALVGPMRLLYPVVAAMGRRQARSNLEALRARIDAGIAPGSSATPRRAR